jgi:hypothetical protein
MRHGRTGAVAGSPRREGLMRRHLSHPDVWGGGAFDLVILTGSRAELAPAAADARIDSVLRAVWAGPWSCATTRATPTGCTSTC